MNKKLIRKMLTASGGPLFPWLKQNTEWIDNWKFRTTPASRSRVLSGKGVETPEQYTERRKKEETKRTWRSDAADIAHGIGEGVLALHPYTAIPYYGAKVGLDFLNGTYGWHTALNASVPLFHMAPQSVGLREATNVALEDAANAGSKTARNWRVAREINLTTKNKPNIEVPNPIEYNISDNITLYRANPTNIKNLSYKGERYGDTSGLYVGKWFTDESSKPNWYASNMAKRGEEPAYYLVTVPRYWAKKQKAFHKISNPSIEYEPEDYIIEDGINGLQGLLYQGRPGTIQYLLLSFLTPIMKEPSTSLKFFERGPSKTTIQISPEELYKVLKDQELNGYYFMGHGTGRSNVNPLIIFDNGLRIKNGDIGNTTSPISLANLSLWPHANSKEIIILPGKAESVKFDSAHGRIPSDWYDGKTFQWDDNPGFEGSGFFAAQKPNATFIETEINGVPGVYTKPEAILGSYNIDTHTLKLNPRSLYKFFKQGGKMNIIEFLKNGSGIHIKKKNRGSFRRWCGGNVTEECIRRGKASSNPKIRKKATFADNARHFKHKNGGKAFVNGVSILDSNPDAYKLVKKKVKMRLLGGMLDTTIINESPITLQRLNWLQLLSNIKELLRLKELEEKLILALKDAETANRIGLYALMGLEFLNTMALYKSNKAITNTSSPTISSNDSKFKLNNFWSNNPSLSNGNMFNNDNNFKG